MQKIRSQQIRRVIVAFTFVAFSLTARAQTRQEANSGQTAKSSAGQAGQRQLRGQALGSLESNQRLDSRIQNRVQSRVRNRIDRFYDPKANATSPFEEAGQRLRRRTETRRP